MITEETIARMKQNLEVKNEFFVLDVIKHLETQIENYKLAENESKEIIAELKSKLEKEQNLNKVIKERLVEVNCDCNAEKKEKCVMFPEYCEGEHKIVVDLLSLVSEGLNESLLKQKEELIRKQAETIFTLNEIKNDKYFEIETLQKENAELKAKLKGFENGDVAWQGDMDKTIKQNLELKEQIEKMKCCQNCTYSTLNECDDLVCELNQFKFPEDHPCVNYSKWRLLDE